MSFIRPKYKHLTERFTGRVWTFAAYAVGIYFYHNPEKGFRSIGFLKRILFYKK
jgi:hypothetical protein